MRARLSSAPGLTAAEGHSFAGLLDAEGHLAIAPNNGNGWKCRLEISLRNDDREILLNYRDKLGIGHLNPVAPRNGSRAQVVWQVQSKLECGVLVDLLDQHPLRGRKSKDYEIWREAVALWAKRGYGVGPFNCDRLAQLAASIKLVRQYREPDPDAALPDVSGSAGRHYFAGFFSGEGCFGLGRRYARFVVKLRRDDKPLLEAFRREFGIGTICDVSARPWSPAAVWHVTGASDVMSGISLFDSVELLGRKARQHAAWRPGAQAVAEAILARGPVDELVVDNARRMLAEATAYKPPSSPLAGDDGGSAARAAYLGVLKTWAATADGSLTCSSYAATRRAERPDWPKRETLAAEFGSWHDALRCAGLQDRALRRPSARQLRVQLDRLHGRQGLRYRAAFLRRLGGLLEV